MPGCGGSGALLFVKYSLHGINFINGVMHSFGCGFDGGGGGVGVGKIGHRKQDGSNEEKPHFDGGGLLVWEVGGSALPAAEGCGMAAISRAMARNMVSW